MSAWIVGNARVSLRPPGVLGLPELRYWLANLPLSYSGRSYVHDWNPVGVGVITAYSLGGCSPYVLTRGTYLIIFDGGGLLYARGRCAASRCGVVRLLGKREAMVGYLTVLAYKKDIKGYRERDGQSC